MKRTTVYLDPEIEIQLQLEAMQRKTPMAEIIREALRDYLGKRPKRLPPGAGEFESGVSNTAERVDEALAESGFGETRD